MWHLGGCVDVWQTSYQRLGVLLPCALMPLLALTHMSLDQLRVLIVVAMLITLGMLFHRTLRHYMLLPSFMALAGSLAAVTLNFSLL